MGTNLALLALASKPKGNKTIYDWRPFGKENGIKICDILNKVHDNVEEITNNWLDTFKELRQYINLIDYDLSEINKLKAIDWDRIHIILIDLNDVKELDDLINKIKAPLLASCGKIMRSICIGQIINGKKLDINSFIPLSVYPSTPPIFNNESDLIQYLTNFCNINNSSIKGYASGIESPAEVLEYGILNRIYSVRDGAIIRGFSAKKTEKLASLSAMQHDAVIGIGKQFYLETRNYPDISNIFSPIDKIIVKTFEEPTPSPCELIYVTIPQPFDSLNDKQKEDLFSLGIRKKTTTLLLKSTETIQNKIKELNGVVTTRELSAMIPTWQIKK